MPLMSIHAPRSVACPDVEDSRAARDAAPVGSARWTRASRSRPNACVCGPTGSRTSTICTRCSPTPSTCAGTRRRSIARPREHGSNARSPRYARRGFALWIVEDRSTGEFLGTAGPTLQLVEDVDEVEIGWHTRPGRKGEGIAPEAAAAARDWAFANLDVDHVISLVRPENQPSGRVAEKIGMHVDREVDHKGLRHRVYRIDRLTWARQTREEHGDRALVAQVPRVHVDRPGRSGGGSELAKGCGRGPGPGSPGVVVPRTATTNGDRDELALGDRAVLVVRFHHGVRDVQREAGELVASSEPERDQLAEQREERLGLGVGLPERGRPLDLDGGLGAERPVEIHQPFFGGRIPRNSQSPPNAVETTSSDALGCAPTSSRIGTVALDDPVAQGAETLDLDLDDVAGFDRAGVRRRPRQDHVAGHERDRARDVGDQVVHVPHHLVGRAVLAHVAVHERPDPLAVEVPVVHQARARAGTACPNPSRAASTPRRCRGSRAGRSRSRPCSRRCGRRRRRARCVASRDRSRSRSRPRSSGTGTSAAERPRRRAR